MGKLVQSLKHLIDLSKRKSGFSTLGVLISLSILGFVLLTLNQSEKYMITNIKNMRKTSEISDIINLIVKNFSCVETRRRTTCTSVTASIDLFSKAGRKFIDSSGSRIGNYDLKADCTSGITGYEIEILYRKSISTPPPWKKLANIAFECPNHFCPKKYSSYVVGMDLIDSETNFDFNTGVMRCTYIHNSNDCPVDDEIYGMVTNRDRQIWFDQKHNTRYVGGVRVLDCFYDLRCNNPAKPKSTPLDSCWP